MNDRTDMNDPNKLTRIRYNPEPDFTRPLLEIPSEARKRMLARLSFLYGDAEAEKWMPELERILKVHHAHKPGELVEAEKTLDPTERFTEKDMILITYGDMIHGEGETPLAVLHKFVQTYNRGAINTLHILPFFPYSSDRGFSVVDFKQVDPNLGTWENILEMAADYDLMFDGVLNHCSSRSTMFREFLRGNPRFRDFFISYESPDELTPDQRSKIFRPRTSDILTKFHTIDGPRYVWTTFSEDQIDINFRNPEALIAGTRAYLAEHDLQMPQAHGLLGADVAQADADKREQDIARLLRQSERFLSMIVAFLSMGMFVFAEEIMLIFGEDFAGLAPMIMRVFAVITFLFAVNRPFDSAAIISNRPWIHFHLTVVLTAANIALNLVLIPKSIFGVRMLGLGAVGSALGTACLAVAGFLMARLVAKWLLGVRTYRGVLTHLFAAAVVGGACRLAKPYLLQGGRWDALLKTSALGVAAAGVYLGLLRLLGEFSAKDLRKILAMMNPARMKEQFVEEIFTPPATARDKNEKEALLTG